MNADAVAVAMASSLGRFLQDATGEIFSGAAGEPMPGTRVFVIDVFEGRLLVFEGRRLPETRHVIQRRAGSTCESSPSGFSVVNARVWPRRFFRDACVMAL